VHQVVRVHASEIRVGGKPCDLVQAEGKPTMGAVTDHGAHGDRAPIGRYPTSRPWSRRQPESTPNRDVSVRRRKRMASANVSALLKNGMPMASVTRAPPGLIA